MTYTELVERNKKLTDAINYVLGMKMDADGDIRTAQNFLQEVMNQVAKEDAPNTKFGGMSRLDGEECGDQRCKHSSTFHSGGKGLCTKVDCECHKFIPTGKANQNAR